MCYQPHPQCQESGKQTRWVGLRDFADLLERALSFEQETLELASRKPISKNADSHDVAGI